MIREPFGSRSRRRLSLAPLKPPLLALELVDKLDPNEERERLLSVALAFSRVEVARKIILGCGAGRSAVLNRLVSRQRGGENSGIRIDEVLWCKLF